MSIPPQYLFSNSGETNATPETLLKICWQRKGWMLFGIGLCVGIGAVVSVFLPRVYYSAAQVSVVKKRPDTGVTWDVRSGAGDGFIAPPQEMLKSSLIIDRAIRAKHLESLPILADAEQPTEAIRTALSITAARTATGQNAVLKVTFRGAEPDDCNTVLQAILDSYREYMEKKHQSGSEDTLELILRDKNALQKALDEKEAAYRTFRATAPLMGRGKDALEMRQERLNALQAKQSAILLQRLEVEGQLAAIERAREAGGSEITLVVLSEFARKSDSVDGPKTPNLQEQLFPLLLEERRLLELHGPKHPDVRAVQHRIEAARRLLVLPPAAWKGHLDDDKPALDAVQLNRNFFKQKLDHLRTAEKLLTSAIADEQDAARQLVVYEIQNDAFKNSIALHQQLYEALVRRLNEVTLVRNAGGYDIEIIEPPAVSKRSNLNPILLALGLSVCLGGMTGAALAYRADRRDRRFRSRAEIARALAMPIIATIDGDGPEPFWKMCNALILLADKGNLKTVQVAGADAAVDVVATRLARALAQSGKRVLLLQNNARAASAPESLKDCPGLSVVEVPQFAPAQFSDVLARQKNRVDFVIVESPPLLASADASAIARMVDVALLVIDSQTTPRPEAERAAQLLTSSGVRVLGAVINDAA